MNLQIIITIIFIVLYIISIFITRSIHRFLLRKRFKTSLLSPKCWFLPIANITWAHLNYEDYKLSIAPMKKKKKRVPSQLELWFLNKDIEI